MSLAAVLSDVHLKPVMFDKMEKILDSGQADFCVCLGDLTDDWGEEYNIGLYSRTLERAIEFYEKYPETLWCVSNHDLGYLFSNWGVRESGHSQVAEPFVLPLIEKLPQQVMHMVDNVIFTHAGLTMDWVDRRLRKVGYREGVMPAEENLISIVNHSSPTELWQENSPIWARPQTDDYEMWQPAMLQVVGHTPARTITEDNNVLSTDTHSTYSNGAPIGDQSFAIVDTEKGTWKYAKQKNQY